MFEATVVECKDANIFGRTQIGVEFKLFGCLRISGRGAHCDDVAEILGCGKTTVNDIIKLFVKNYSEVYYDVHVYVPEWEELDQVVADHAKMGFSGCVGSMDRCYASYVEAVSFGSAACL
jgi:hypothetical protein